MEINWKLIDSEIRELKLTNKKMAELLGIGLATFNRYRTNSTDIPFKLLYRLLEILDLPFTDVIINSNIAEYKKYFKEGRYFDEDERNKHIKRIDDEVEAIKKFKTKQEFDDYFELMELFGDERIVKVAKGYIEYMELRDILGK